MKPVSTKIFLLLLSHTLTVLAHNNLDYINLVNNRYTGVTIGIDPRIDISQTTQQQVVDDIKDLMTRSSSALYKATGKFSFNDVRIHIPDSWTEINQAEEKAMKWSDGTIILRENNQRITPYTIHSGACGVEGLRIDFPITYLIDSAVQQKYGLPEKVMVQEWLKLRYGVFEEHGYIGDSMYPYLYMDYVANATLPSSCINTDATTFEWEDSNGDTCEADYANPNCRPKLVDTTSEQSIMYATFTDSVEKVCTEETHNPSAPTKQNKLCQSRSVDTVMQEHRDFSNSNKIHSINSETTPSFTITKSPSSADKKMLILMDNHCGGENPFNKGQCRISALAMFTELRNIVRMLIEEKRVTHFGFAKFTGIISIEECSHKESDYFQYFNNEPLTEIDQINLDDLLEFIPIDPDTTNFETCALSAIGKSLKDLKALQTNGEISGEVEIVFIQMVANKINDKTPPEYDETHKDFHIHGVLSGKARYNPELESLTEESGGSYYFNEKYSPFYVTNVITSVFHDDGIVQEITQETLDVNNVATEKSLQISESFGLKTTVTITRHTTDPELVVTLKDPSSQAITEVIKNDNLIKFYIDDAPKGDWILSLESQSDTKSEIQLSVLSTPRTDKDQVEVKVWTSLSTESVDIKEEDFKVFASIRKGALPVMSLNVKFVMYKSEPSQEIVYYDIPLSDDGIGDPDVQKFDGIYSGYVSRFSDLSSSRDMIVAFDLSIESITMTEEDETKLKMQRIKHILPRALPENPFDDMPCCGSIDGSGIKENVNINTVTNIRITVSNTQGYNPRPGNILDFTITSVENEGQDIDENNVKIGFTWTEPGEDFNIGTAAKYELRSSDDMGILNSNFGFCPEVDPNNIVEGNLNPGPAGTQKNIKVLFPKTFQESSITYIAIKAFDNQGNSNNVSPISSFFVPSTDVTTTSTTTTTTTTTTTESTTTPATESTTSSSTTTPATESTTESTTTTEETEFVGSGGFWAVISISIIVVVGGVAGGAFYFIKRKNSSAELSA